MNKTPRRDYATLLVIALAFSVVGWAWREAGAPASSAAVIEAEVLPAPAMGPGHGNYCLVPDRGAYFYGHDFDDESGTYERFAEWCRENGGIVGWVE